ncbi:hypothetical protein [Chitinimonas sp. BJB300]|uniref:hypothetical protein n=1 Tax=Chitinimonas sp. BJB300 TaxID=1559339 RepID=UPI000C10A4A6|nr:hypothetical protein [Chitinimonas sp. BJB300]PHV11918.1 hypothetical protein CSQ89_08325 [Chitinimonas sp. BJB300]
MSDPCNYDAFRVPYASLEFLIGAGPLAIAIYFVLLSVTDPKTSLAGARTIISRQMLREWTEREIRRGRGLQRAYQATDNELRRALEELERRQLIERTGSAERLVFRMLGI